jgi:chaperonin GroES
MIKPMNDKVVIKLIEASEVTAGGIVLPKASRERRQDVKTGCVVRVGPGRLKEDGTRVPMNVKQGDKVILNWGGTDVDLNGEEFRIVVEGDILAVLE